MNAMNRWTRYLMLVVATVSTFVMLAPDAEARRMGGGRSFGKSPDSMVNRSNPPASAPRSNATDGAPAAAAGAAAGARRGGMMGPIAGLAAGLGLAALASYMGFGEELANFMMIMLLLVGGLFLVRFIMSRFGGGRAGGAQRGGLAPAGNAPGSFGGSMNRDNGRAGFDAARGGASGAISGPSTAQPSDLSGDTGLPAGFDAPAFVNQAKLQFVRLQAVYDEANLADLAEFTTPEVFAELKSEIAERGDQVNKTDVVTLNAELLGVDDSGPEYLASVQFHGMIRQQADAAAEPFDEIWTMSKPRSGGGWVLAGIQQSDARG